MYFFFNFVLCVRWPSSLLTRAESTHLVNKVGPCRPPACPITVRNDSRTKRRRAMCLPTSRPPALVAPCPTREVVARPGTDWPPHWRAVHVVAAICRAKIALACYGTVPRNDKDKRQNSTATIDTMPMPATDVDPAITQAISTYQCRHRSPVLSTR